MADAMDVDTPRPTDDRKRKHKHKDASPSKKRKHGNGEKKSKKDKRKTKTPAPVAVEDVQTTAVDKDSPFTLTTATMYLPLSPVSISTTHALQSLLAEHISPLLLTYYPPLKGVVLAHSNASISTTPPGSSPPSTSTAQDPNPKPMTLATTAGEYGVLYVFLTATFLVFRPQRGQILDGWVNVQSEGFLGAVVLNLFSVGIERKRLPKNWNWIAPGDTRQPANPAPTSTSEDESDARSGTFNPDREHFHPVTLASDANPLSDTLEGDDADIDAAEGYFQSVSGHRVRGTVKFRVVDIDIIAGTEKDVSFMSIEGTMLTPEEETRVLENEKKGVVSREDRAASASAAGSASAPTAMSGAVGSSPGQSEIQQQPEAGPSSSSPKKADKKEKKDKKDKEKAKPKKKKIKEPKD